MRKEKGKTYGDRPIYNICPSKPVVESRNESSRREAVGGTSRWGCLRGAMRICGTADEPSDPRAF
jgi:hypothetical protein